MGSFVCVGYNMGGIRAQELAPCLRSLSREVGWHVLLGQEVTKAAFFPSEVDGHIVITGATRGGARIPGIVVCDEWSDYIASEPVFKGMTVGVLLDHPQIGPIFLISAHLSATTSRDDYQNSLDCLYDVIDE